MTDDFISSDRGLSGAHRHQLQAFAGTVIPASADYGVPGADDPAIAADIARTAEGSAGAVAEALDALDALARQQRRAAFTDLDEAGRLTAARAFRSAQPSVAVTLLVLVAQCYYRDDRVMASLGMEPRAPFPEGFELEQGDWSLLDPVRKRDSMVRDA